MGRVNGEGPFDLFRFTSAGNRLFTGGSTAAAAYFSIDGGNSSLGDFGRTSDPSDFLNVSVPNDPFDEGYSTSTIQSLTNLDKGLLNVLGFNVNYKASQPGSYTYTPVHFYPTSINDAGEIVGYTGTYAFGQLRGVIYNGTSTVTFDAAPGGLTFATGVNNRLLAPIVSTTLLPPTKASFTAMESSPRWMTHQRAVMAPLLMVSIIPGRS